MQFIKKSDCHLKNGYVVSNGLAVALPFNVFNELCELSIAAQAAKYNMENRPTMPKTVEPFKPLRSYTDFHGPEVECETPALDKAVKETLAIISDIEEKDKTEKINKMISEDFPNLALFIDEDEFLPSTGTALRLPIDPSWNILEWTQDDIMVFLELIAEFGGVPFNME